MTAKAWRSCRVTINGRVRKLSYSDDAIKKLFLPFLQRLSDLSRREGRRIVIYLAAPADTGKTTLALFLERLSLLGAASGLLPLQRLGLEGFQRQADELDADGKPLSPYGPKAFDTEELTRKLAALAAGEELRWPVFDRARHEAVPDITPVRKPIVLVEGCWLLLKRDGWENLRSFADYTLAIMAQPESLAARTTQRLIARGLTPRAAHERYDRDYRPAIMQVLTDSWPADETWIYSADGDYQPQPDRLRNYRAKQKQTQMDFDSVKRKDEPIFRAYEEQMTKSGGQTFALGYQQGLETARRNILRRLAGAGGMGREALMETFHITEAELDDLLS
ncbi:MAG: hypothetical protein ACI4OK_05805 [Selenomonas bovis]